MTRTFQMLPLSRRVTKGVRIFRIFRDDEYLYRMMSILSRCVKVGINASMFAHVCVGVGVGVGVGSHA